MKKLFTGCHLSNILATTQSIVHHQDFTFENLTTLCLIDDVWLKLIQMKKVPHIKHLHCLVCVLISQQKKVMHCTIFSGE
jgi:hypothetical protein